MGFRDPPAPEQVQVQGEFGNWEGGRNGDQIFSSRVVGSAASKHDLSLKTELLREVDRVRRV